MDNTSLIVASSEAGFGRELAVAPAPDGVAEDSGRLAQWVAGFAAEHQRAMELESEFPLADSDPAMLSLRARLGQLLSMLAQHPAIGAATGQAELQAPSRNQQPIVGSAEVPMREQPDAAGSNGPQERAIENAGDKPNEDKH